MPDPVYPIEKILALLRESPRRIEQATLDLTEDQLHRAPAQGEWCANEVLAHLRACGDVWGGHILAILSEDRPTRRGVSPTTYIKQTNYLELAFHPSYQAYAAHRSELLAVLSATSPASWERTAWMSAWGQEYEKTLLRFADNLARHERHHVRQIENIASVVRLG